VAAPAQFRGSGRNTTSASTLPTASHWDHTASLKPRNVLYTAEAHRLLTHVSTVKESFFIPLLLSFTNPIGSSRARIKRRANSKSPVPVPVSCDNNIQRDSKVPIQIWNGVFFRPTLSYLFSIYPNSLSAKPLHRTSPVRSLYSCIRLSTILRSISPRPISLTSVFLATPAFFFFVTIVSKRILSLSSVFFCQSPIKIEPWRSSTSC
jgi:hypothetical protein